MNRLLRRVSRFSAAWLLALALPWTSAQSAPQAPSGNAAHGQQLFARYGCYECHGYQGQGGGVAGPKLAPSPLPYEVVLRILRKPLDRMAVYTVKVLPEQDAADIYAYLQSIPAARDVAQIPLLR